MLTPALVSFSPQEAECSSRLQLTALAWHLLNSMRGCEAGGMLYK